MAEPPLLVDPAVSRVKFERELATYRALADDHRRRGWWLLDAEFPTAFVVFATPRVKPPAVVFGAVLDFSNYDFWPPSVRLVDPFTCEPYRARDLPGDLRRRVPVQLQPELAGLGLGSFQNQPMMQFLDPEELPFLCLPGVREYHEHPGHSGDSWLLHRGKGEGTLHFILNQLYTYGVQPINGYQVGLQVVGFIQQDVPE